MELVYLWVEDYKNIHKQGFNFSSKFICDYNGETLTIKDNVDEKGKKQYIENFFGDNINVTAIVGKNGSGKSSLIESFLEIIVGIKNTNMIKITSKYILVYDNKYISNIDSINIDKKYIEQKIDFFTISLDYSLDTFTNEIYRSEAHYRYEEKKKYILEPNKFSQNKANINLDIDSEKMRKRIITYQSELNNNALLSNNIFIPNKIIIRFDARRIFYKGTRDKKENKKGNYFSKISNENYIEEIKELNKIFLDNDEYIPDEEKEKAHNVLKFLNELEKIFTFRGNEFKMGATANIRTQDGITLDFCNLTPEFLKLIGSLPRYFLLDFISENNLNFTDLSTGEQHLQKLIYTIIDYCFQVKDENILVFIDEVELYLHPQWQKNYIKMLLEGLSLFLKSKNKRIHFILTTHSPFLLSDIPKQNIIFLDTHENGKCKVLKHDEVMAKKQTFGANIHTLLSDSFFMEDGLMGEFAKGKIDKVFKLLNKTTLSVEEQAYCEDIISIIGEPIIKNQLQKMLNHKRLSKVDKIDEMQKQIELLQEEVKKLKSNE